LTDDVFDELMDEVGLQDIAEDEPMRLYVREFLNKVGYHSSAHIIAEVADTSAEVNSKGEPNLRAGWCSLTIGDCHRHISLSLGLRSPDERANTRYKLDLLVNTLVKFRDAVFAEADLADLRQPLRDAQRQARRATRPRADETTPSGTGIRLDLFNDLATRVIVGPDGTRYRMNGMDEGAIILAPEGEVSDE
jgi:hypothetical protein